MIGTIVSLLGPLSICVVLVTIGLLSRRLGSQTQAKPFYLGFFAAAVLMLISIAVMFADFVLQAIPRDREALLILLEDGLPALAVTIGVIFAWRYWSWLLAERD